ncbi:RCC1/BLIP-II [Dichomitus squalens]|uniref:RCC1/BLIP-II n=1 Tax=Dichomitus squalens TaxID=114155 RepID=A0A4Q9PUH2_9APHY|nr:RCC1/BLIP-II [Dichomitus squalens]
MPCMDFLTLLSTGSNSCGQLGIGNIDDVHRFTPCIFRGAALGSLPEHVVGIEQIACGGNHTLALLRTDDGKTKLWGCGDGRKGQLGPSYTSEVREKAENAAVFRRLDLGAHLERAGILSGISEEYNTRLVAAGWETTYAVLSYPNRSDVLLSMGSDDYGNLGVDTNTQRTRHDIYVVDLRRAVRASDDSMSTITILSLAAGPHHTIVHVRLRDPDGSSVTYFAGWALGRHHTVYMQTSGKLVGLGSNRKGQLDELSTLDDVEQVGCTWNGTYALLRSGTVVATGSNTHSQLGRGPTVLVPQSALQPVAFLFSSKTHRVASLVCGSEHVLCLVDAGQHGLHREVWGWGWNEHGNLGTGGTADTDVPLRVWPPASSAASCANADADDSTTSREGSGNQRHGDVLNVWAGCGTSWILVRKLGLWIVHRTDHVVSGALVAHITADASYSCPAAVSGVSEPIRAINDIRYDAALCVDKAVEQGFAAALHTHYQDSAAAYAYTANFNI